MILHHVSDWNDAYANTVNIADGDRWPARWADAAKTFRERKPQTFRAEFGNSYGERPRNRFDLFLPGGEPRGLVVYVHGGFWVMLDNSFGSHLAAGPLAHGYAVAQPTYTLAPEIRVSDITREVAAAIACVADRVGGPIRLVGHSAGGHLVTRMVTETSRLPPSVRTRIRHVVSIAGLHDLRPLVHLSSNAQMRIDDAEAIAESPALLRPLANTRLTCWVGAIERAEFVRQSALLANVWTGLGAATAYHAEPDKHHFTIVDGLADANHPLTRALLA